MHTRRDHRQYGTGFRRKCGNDRRIDKGRESIGSEAYAQKRETLEEEWQKCYGVLEEKYLQLMNRNICLHTGEGWEELKIMFSDAAFIQTFEKNDSFLEMNFLLEIYEAEVQAGVRHTVLDTEAQNIDELWEPIRNLRFSIWRVNAAGIPEMGEELCRRIQEENISSVALLFVIRSALEKTGVMFWHHWQIFFLIIRCWYMHMIF